MAAPGPAAATMAIDSLEAKLERKPQVPATYDMLFAVGLFKAVRAALGKWGAGAQRCCPDPTVRCGSLSTMRLSASWLWTYIVRRDTTQCSANRHQDSGRVRSTFQTIVGMDFDANHRFGP